jgi:hypothetical protein
MSEVFVALVEKLPVGFLMGFLPIMCAAGVWGFAHIRVDKQGKRYWYSQKYEDTKRNRKQDVILKAVSGLDEAVLQLQICSDELPDTAQRDSFLKYKERGYNSWVDKHVVKKKLFTQEEVDYINRNQGGKGNENRTAIAKSKAVF